MRVLRSKLAPGMILETGAMDHGGRMLIGADTELNERLLVVLDTARIPIVYVTQASYEACKTCPDLPPLSREQERELRSRFRHVDLEGPFAQAVFDECRSHEQETSAGGAEVVE